MSGFIRLVRSFATALMGQFCSDIGLKASGETTDSFFGRRTMWARLIRSVSQRPR